VDIAHARLEFAGGAVANITASRVSTERVRKMRFFQQHEYISLDYARRDALRIGVKTPGPQPEFGFEKLKAPASSHCTRNSKHSSMPRAPARNRAPAEQRDAQRSNWPAE